MCIIDKPYICHWRGENTKGTWARSWSRFHRCHVHFSHFTYLECIHNFHRVLAHWRKTRSPPEPAFICMEMLSRLRLLWHRHLHGDVVSTETFVTSSSAWRCCLDWNFRDVSSSGRETGSSNSLPTNRCVLECMVNVKSLVTFKIDTCLDIVVVITMCSWMYGQC